MIAISAKQRAYQTHILNAAELAKECGANTGTIFLLLEEEGFPVPRYYSGKRVFWSHDQIPDVKGWLGKRNYEKDKRGRKKGGKNAKKTD